MLTSFLVDTLEDVVDPDDGFTSFREAVVGANELPGEDRIEFSEAMRGEMMLRLGTIMVSDTLTILGPGPDQLTINARGLDPTPELNNRDGQPAIEMARERREPYSFMHLRGVTVTGADSTGLEGLRGSLSHVVVEGNRAGGIGVAFVSRPNDQDNEWFRIFDSEFLNNSIHRGFGGAIASGAKLHIERSVFRGNSADDAGAIETHNDFRIYDSLFEDNLARGDGGVIYATVPSTVAPSAEIYHSTFANNVTLGASIGDGADGSAIATRGFQDVTIVGSTFSGNEIRTAEGLAIGTGVIHISGEDPVTRIERSTIVNNRHTGPTADLAWYGGVIQSAGSLTILNSIVANNSADQLLLPPQSEIRHSFIGVSHEVGLPPTDGGVDVNGNRVGAPQRPLDPKLAPLALNGSLLPTHLPLPGSPVVNAGDAQFVAEEPRMEFDQRGTPWQRVVDGRLDMGGG